MCDEIHKIASKKMLNILKQKNKQKKIERAEIKARRQEAEDEAKRLVTLWKEHPGAVCNLILKIR